MKKKIYIPFDFTEDNLLPLWRQFPDTIRTEWKDCIFTFQDCDDYDYLAVIDNIHYPFKTHCPRSRRFVFLGEPPSVRKYSKAFIRQFGHIHTCIRNRYTDATVINSFPALPWMVGYSQKEGSNLAGLQGKYMTYNDFLTLPDNPQRKDKACIITSSKTMTEGHRRRVQFVTQVLADQVPYIDIYGNGYNHIDDKMDALYHYKYALIIENCNYPDYWTEKLADCILAGCYPIYCGAPNISKYFNEGITIADITNYHETLHLLKTLIDNDTYNTSREAMQRNKLKVLNHYNCFNIIAQTISQHQDPTPTLERKAEVIIPSMPSIPVRLWLRIKKWLHTKRYTRQ